MGMGREPTPIEEAAQQWHDERRDDRNHLGGCWCCCIVCDPDYGDRAGPNPYFEAAQVAMRHAAGAVPMSSDDVRKAAESGGLADLIERYGQPGLPAGPPPADLPEEGRP